MTWDFSRACLHCIWAVAPWDGHLKHSVHGPREDPISSYIYLQHLRPLAAGLYRCRKPACAIQAGPVKFQQDAASDEKLAHALA